MGRNLVCLILAIFPVVFATENINELAVLKNLTDGGNKKILEISNILDDTPKGYRELTAERFNCLQWECISQEKYVNKTTAESVIKGLLKNKKLTSFQCISNNTRETLEKLNAASSSLPQDSEMVLKKSLGAVMPYRFLISGFNRYVQDLYETKKEELKNASSEEAKKKILAEVENKMKVLLAVLEQIGAHIETMKNKFFELYVCFAYEKENLFRKIQKEGTQKILKCIN